MMATSACDCVIAVPELLELILLELSPTDLLLSQRINKTFRTCVNETPSLQRRLYYRTQLRSQEQHDDDLEQPTNTLLFEYPGPGFLRRSTYISNFGVEIRCELQQDDNGPCAQVTMRNWNEEDYDDILSTDTSSYMGMYPTARSLPIKFVLYKLNQSFKNSNFHQATVLVKPATLRELLELAAGLQRAGQKKEDDVRYEQEWEWDEAGRIVYGYERPKFDFDWKLYFTREQMDSMLEDPEIMVS